MFFHRFLPVFCWFWTVFRWIFVIFRWNFAVFCRICIVFCRICIVFRPIFIKKRMDFDCFSSFFCWKKIAVPLLESTLRTALAFRNYAYFSAHPKHGVMASFVSVTVSFCHPEQSRRIYSLWIRKERRAYTKRRDPSASLRMTEWLHGWQSDCHIISNVG